MLVLGIAVAIALVLPLLTGGSYTRLVMTEWRWSAALFAGLAIQLALEFLPVPESRWDDLGFGLLVVSYVCIIAFCARNLILRGMAIVLVGVACNAVVIAVNNGMPVEVPADWQANAWVEETVKHHPSTGDDRLLFLADIIVLRSPFDTVLSFGDLILAIGLCDVTYHASRRRRARRSIAPTPTEPLAIPGRSPGAPLLPRRRPFTTAAATVDLTITDDGLMAPQAPQPVAAVGAGSVTARSSALSTRSS